MTPDDGPEVDPLVLETARQAVREFGEDPDALRLQTDEDGDTWILHFLNPDPRARGGGVGVRVDKTTGEVVRVEGYQ